MILDLPALTTPFLKETLFVYLAASKEAVSTVLLVVRQGKQHPIHYISRTLHDAERNYALLEKMALALRHASRRLRRYFEAYPITVITDQPIKQVLSKADMSGRLAQYSVELGACNIIYEPHNAIKGKILADFINEMPMGSEAMVPRAKGSGAGLVLISPPKIEYTYTLRLNFKSTNNQAEHEALLAGLRTIKKMRVQSLSVNVDSKLVVSQINGNYEPCKENMIRYLNKAKEYIGCFKNFKIQNIPRNKNQKANVLSKLVSVAFNHLTKEILVETLDVPSMDGEEINAVVEEEGETWMTPTINCLKREYGQNTRMRHERSVVEKAIRQGYCWPTMHQDAREEIRKCDSCQIHSLIPKLPKILMTLIMTPWSFFQWGMDVIGPLPETPGKINTTVPHPQANRLVERENRSLVEGIKTRLRRERKVWVDELPNILWAHWTSLKTSNGETPYSLTFGSEAVIPTETSMPTHWTMMIKEGNGNKEEMRLNLELIIERREAAAIREARPLPMLKERQFSDYVIDKLLCDSDASRCSNTYQLGRSQYLQR
ncbi:reverse transcriptase domain-containing protein [Tanacetum coccineum]